jgi:hypothetical protein
MSKREDVLARVFEVLSGIAGFQSKFRNRGFADQDARPIVILMDGDEKVNSQIADRPGRVKMSPVVMVMSPQVFIILKNRQPQNENTGQDLNAYRKLIIEALANDTTLLSLIGLNGDIFYTGCETDLKSGAAVEGQMRLDFTISCVLKPTDV